MELETWPAPPGDRIPNHPRFPVLLYRGVHAATEDADAARELFSSSHVWRGSWVDGHRRATARSGFTVVGA
jgi:uncharacterized protein YjlB